LNNNLVIYYIGGRGTHNMFRVNVGVTLSDLKKQLDWINGRLNHDDTRMVVSVKYRRPLIDPNGHIQFTQMKLQNDDDVRTMFSIFDQYCSKGRIKWDITFVRFVHGIRESSIQLRTSKEIKVNMDEPDE